MTKLSQVLQQYRKAKGFGIVELARDIGAPRQTVEEWLYNDAVPGPRYSEILAVRFPGVFDGEWAISVAASHPSAARTVLSVDVDETELVAKTCLAADHITSLAELFTWFLFRTTAGERNRFRTHLGKKWEEFTHLAHAMIGEKAFEVIREEGKLHEGGA